MRKWTGGGRLCSSGRDLDGDVAGGLWAVGVGGIARGGGAGAQRVEFPNTAHWLNVEYADQFNQPVLEFLAAHPL